MPDATPAHISKPPRQYQLDIIRGIAVLLMISAHAIDFYHDDSLSYLRHFVTFANTFVFSTFLFISGAVAFIAYLNREDKWTKVRRRLIQRLLVFLLGYYLLALISLGDKIIAASIVERWKILTNIITFQNIPAYTEFLIPFFVYGALLIFLPQLYKKVAANWRLALSYSLLLYIAGFLLYYLPVPASLIPWKALLVGHNHLFRFPILQYAPIYIAGLQWGNWLLAHSHAPDRRRLSLKIMAVTSLSLAAIAFIYFSLNTPWDKVFLRWPPSPVFILIGLAFIFFLNFILSYRQEMRAHPFMRDTFLLLGQNAFALFWTHIFLLKLFQLSGGAQVSSLLIVASLFLTLLITSLALATFIPFNFAFHLTFIRESGGRPFRAYDFPVLPSIYQLAQDISHRPHVIHRTGYALAAIFLFALTFSLFGAPRHELIAQSPPPLVWWDRDYAYNRPLTIKNQQSLSTLQSNSLVSFSLNHQKLVQEKKSLITGSDIRLVFYNGKDFQEIHFWPQTPWNSDQTTLAFLLAKDIGPGQESTNYFIYYGNNIASTLNHTSKALPSTPGDARITLGDESPYELLAETSRIWVLKSDKITATEPIVFSVRLPSPSSLMDPIVDYEVVGTNLRGLMYPVSEDTWEVSLDASSLAPGTYRARAILKDSGATTISQNAGFRVSYPLYVAWTQDWEGYDIPEAYLEAMASITKQHHNLPITHYFNPRIYTAPDISSERRQYLTNWVKNRRDSFSEEIALHLHMFPDYVTDADVAPRNDPRWGFNNDGYDILTSAYTYEETLKLLNRAKQWFDKYDLGTPVAYRAGGWFADSETLKAVQDAGFLADSSGRTAYKFGARKQPGFWNLPPTTKPYYPSESNQNSAAPPPNLTILEIPNNGADSYAFSAKDMIDRFQDNFTGEALTEKQQITYLSHPHWFNRAEQQRVEELFSHIDQFLFDLDRGPIRYVTTSQIYQAWSN